MKIKLKQFDQDYFRSVKPSNLLHMFVQMKTKQICMETSLREIIKHLRRMTLPYSEISLWK